MLICPFSIIDWHYDFFKVTYGAGVIYGYAIIIPLIFWGYLVWMDVKMNLSEVFCIYGYSLFIYIFVAVLLFYLLQFPSS